ncbi:TPA: hypothetical protein KQG29_003576 [Clostridioides difficile]|nr:hypothetical protein [Clostridioides difficile]
MSSLTAELYELGFNCGIELEVYIQDTGTYTSLVIEGFQKGVEEPYTYDFYKQTFYPHYPNKITVYGEHLNPSQLIERVERYFINRKKYMSERRNNT